MVDTQVQFRRGTTAENDAFTGAVGEMTIDTIMESFRIHDGSQAGGFHVGASPHERKTADYTALRGDRCKLLEFDSGSAITLDLTAAATLLEGWFVYVNNSGAGTLTIDPNGAELIDDASTITLDQNQSTIIFCDGAAFWTVGRTTADGLTSISNTAITAVTNIDVTGFVPGTYDNYEVWISNGQPADDGVLLEMETSTDGGSSFDTGVSDYTWAKNRVSEGATNSLSGDPDDARIELGGTVGNAANENASVKISIFNPETAEFTSFTWQMIFRSTLTDFFTLVGGGNRQSAADVNALRFHWSAGNWVAQGNIQFLGIVQ